MAKRLFTLLIAVAGLTLWLQTRIDVMKKDLKWSHSAPFVPPDRRLVKLATLGFHTLLADVYWLREIQYYAEVSDRKEFPEDLYAMTQFITDLDPRFAIAYYFTGVNLTIEGGSSVEIIAILDKGKQNCPTYYPIPFQLGFYYYFVTRDNQKAADNLELAYQLSKVPIYALLATRLRSQAGSPELAIRFLQEMIKRTENEKMIERLNQRILELQANILERDLTAAAAEYHRRYGFYPTKLQVLAAAGIIRGLPPHPVAGHHFVFDPQTQKVKSDPPIFTQVFYNPKHEHPGPAPANPPAGGH